MSRSNPEAAQYLLKVNNSVSYPELRIFALDQTRYGVGEVCRTVGVEQGRPHVDGTKLPSAMELFGTLAHHKGCGAGEERVKYRHLVSNQHPRMTKEA